MPPGQSVMLTNFELKDLIVAWEDYEKKYRRHIERLQLKKKPGENGFYEIKTPIPAHPDRCFVCQCNIPEGVDYKGHISSE